MLGDFETPEAVRLEALWGGEFGDAYVERNRDAARMRGSFWQHILSTYPIASALEVGCNLGGNLYWLAQHLATNKVWGVDLNTLALQELRKLVPTVNAVVAPARELPFRDRWFDLAFTMGVLIHQPESTLPVVMAELVRCSRRFVFCGEYYSAQTIEVSYRNQPGSLFKRDYGQLYRHLFPELRQVQTGHLSKDIDWDDDITWWLFEKR